MKRIVLTAGILLAVTAMIATPGPAGEKGDGWVKLFNGKDLSGWSVFLDPKKEADPTKVFTVQDGIIVCEGTPFGYLITDKKYENYLLKVQWRWGQKVHGKVRNSGVFVHVVGPNKIWPKAVEAQLMADHAGDFWLVDGFQLKVDPKRQDPKNKRHFVRAVPTPSPKQRHIGRWSTIAMPMACLLPMESCSTMNLHFGRSALSPKRSLAPPAAFEGVVKTI